MFTKVDLKGRQRDGKHCDLCGCSFPAVRCDKCGSQIFCLSCDDMYHRHPKRKFHLRKAVDPTPTPQARPVLPIKISNLTAVPGDPSKMPLPPPRRKKPGKSIFDSFRRGSPASDDGSFSKKDYSWTDRLGSIKKFMSNRPLPPVPPDEEENAEPESSQTLPMHNLSFIHQRVDEKPPALPQRSQLKSQVPLKDLVNEDLQRSNTMTNGVKSNFESGNQGIHNTENFKGDQQQFLSNRFGTLQRPNNLTAFPPYMHPSYPGDKANGMHQSSSATDLTSLPGMQGYPQYQYNPHLPPQYPFPYPMYPQFPPYPSQFGSSWANLNSHSHTTDGDFSDHSESSASHVSKGRHRFSNKAKRSQSVLMDNMTFQGQFYPYGPYPPGCPPWVPVMSSETPPSPGMARRSSSRASHSRRRRKVTDEDDDDYLSSSPISRPKSSSSEMSRNCQKIRNYSSSESSEEGEVRSQTPSKSKSFEGKKLNKHNFRRRGSSPRLQSASNASGDEKKGQDIRHRKKSKEKISLKQHDDSPEKSQIEKSKEAKTKTEKNSQPSENEIKEDKSSQYVPSTKWRCRYCTFINNWGERICQVCCRTATKSVSPIEDASSEHQEITNDMSEQTKQQEVIEESCSEKQDMAVLNSALDEAEKEINRSLNELLKVQNYSVQEQDSQNVLKMDAKPEHERAVKNQQTINLSTFSSNKATGTITSATAPVKDQTVYTGNFHAKALSLQNNNIIKKHIATGTIETSATPSILTEKVKDSSCQTITTDDAENSFSDSAAVYPGKSNDMLYADDIPNYQVDSSNNIQPRISRGIEGEHPRSGYRGILHRSHSRASLFTGRINDASSIEYGDGNNHGPRAMPMYRSISRASLLGEAESWSPEYPSAQKPKFYLSMEELVERRRQETMRAQGLELVRMIREAEQQGFTADDIQIAINNCGKQNPLVWLQDNWGNIVKTVVSLATNYGKDKAENDVGAISDNESRDALRLHKGNIWAAVTECVEGRQRKFLELSARGNFTFKEITDALNSSDGDVESAFAKLTNTSMKPFLMRIWGSGEGVPNLEGAVSPDSASNFHSRSIEFLNKSRYQNGSNEGSENMSWEDEDYEEEDEIDWKSDEIPADEEDDEEPVTAYGTLRPSDINGTQSTEFLIGDKLLTPESDKSEYCDAFGSGLDERYLSSGSIDEIYLIDAEAKESLDFNPAPKRKSSGLLEKLAAFRNKKVDMTDTNTSTIPTQNDSCETDKILKSSNDKEKADIPKNSDVDKHIFDKTSEKSNTETTFHPFEAVKQAFGAMKSSIVGTAAKSNASASRTVSEKRTIIVRDRIGMEVVPSEKSVDPPLIMNAVVHSQEMEHAKKESGNDSMENLSISGTILTACSNLVGATSLDNKSKNSQKDTIEHQNSELNCSVVLNASVNSEHRNNLVQINKNQAKVEISNIGLEKNMTKGKGSLDNLDESSKRDLSATETDALVKNGEAKSFHSPSKISKDKTSESLVQKKGKVSSVEHLGFQSVVDELETHALTTEADEYDNTIMKTSAKSIQADLKMEKSNAEVKISNSCDDPNRISPAQKTETTSPTFIKNSDETKTEIINIIPVKAENISHNVEQPDSFLSHLELVKDSVVDEVFEEKNPDIVQHLNHSDKIETITLCNQSPVAKIVGSNDTLENQRMSSSPLQNSPSNSRITDVEAENSKQIRDSESKQNLVIGTDDKPQRNSDNIIAAAIEQVLHISENLNKENKDFTHESMESSQIKETESSIIPHLSNIINKNINENENHVTLSQSCKNVFDPDEGGITDLNVFDSQSTSGSIINLNRKEAVEEHNKFEISDAVDKEAKTSGYLPSSECEVSSAIIQNISSSENQVPGISTDSVEKENETVFHKLNTNDSNTIIDHTHHSETDMKYHAPSDLVQEIEPSKYQDAGQSKETEKLNQQTNDLAGVNVLLQNGIDENSLKSIPDTLLNTDSINEQEQQLKSALNDIKVIMREGTPETLVHPKSNTFSSCETTSISKISSKPKKKKNAGIKATQGTQSIENSSKIKPVTSEPISFSQNEILNNLDSALSSYIETRVLSENQASSIDGVKTSTKSTDGVKTATKSTDEVKTTTKSIDGIKTATKSTDGVKTATKSTDGVKTATKSIDGVQTASRFLNTDFKIDDQKPSSSSEVSIEQSTPAGIKSNVKKSSENNVEESDLIMPMDAEAKKNFTQASENILKTSTVAAKPATLKLIAAEIFSPTEQNMIAKEDTDKTPVDLLQNVISNATSQTQKEAQAFDQSNSNSTSLIIQPESNSIIQTVESSTEIESEKTAMEDSSINKKLFENGAIKTSSIENMGDTTSALPKSENNCSTVQDQVESSVDISTDSSLAAKSSGATTERTDSTETEEDITSSIISDDVSIPSQSDGMAAAAAPLPHDQSESAGDSSSFVTKNVGSAIPTGLNVSVRPASPIKPVGLLRRMSFNTRREAIFQERYKDDASNSVEERPWFVQKKPEPVKQVIPKRSIKQQLEFERKVRNLVSERKCRTYRKAEIVVQLMDLKFDENESIYAANECSTFDMALSFLQQECQLCAGKYPAGEIVSMINCPHKACKECIKAYFTIQIRDRTIMEVLCPFCNEPDITDEDIAQDYFNHLDIMLKKLVDPDIHELFQRKLRDRVLMKDPNFRWCSQCSSGFIADPHLRKLMCPDCNAITCAGCRRRWEREHEGVSCEAFAEWKDAHDPDAQTYSLAKLLTEEGIDCPSCHFRYALAKGGCMHFKCIQCHHDFCSGCSRPFKMGQRCGVSEFCVKLGLHAHHPRNCLFYLRDKEPNDLQRLLNMNNIQYNKDNPFNKDGQTVCQVLEQKETSQGMVDDVCGKEVQEGFAGLCRVHYVEYLGQLVNKYKIDPIHIFDNDDLELVLKRASIRLPPKKYRESFEEYREKLVQLIEEMLPISEVDGS